MSRSTGLMRRISNCVPQYVIKMLYFSIFYYHMIYAVTVWGGTGINNTRKMANIQRRALKLFENGYGSSKPFDYWHLYSFYLMRKFQTIVHGDNSQYFYYNILPLIPDHEHLTRFSSMQKFNIPRHGKSMSEKQFLYNAIKQWNDLPVHLKQPLSPDSFKSKLKKILSENWYGSILLLFDELKKNLFL